MEGSVLDLFEGSSGRNVILLQTLLHQHQRLSQVAVDNNNPFLAEANNLPEAHLREAVYHSIRGESANNAISASLTRAAHSYSLCTLAHVQMAIKCLKTAISFQNQDESTRLDLLLSIGDVYTTAASICHVPGGDGGQSDVDTVHYLWSAMDYLFELWQSEESSLVVNQDMISIVVENCLILCQSCQNLQQHQDALCHAERCVSYLEEHYPAIAFKLPKFLKLTAFAAELASRFKPSEHCQVRIKKVLNSLTEIGAVYSVECAFILDAACRILFRQEQSNKTSVTLIQDFAELSQLIWRSLNRESNEFRRELKELGENDVA